MSMASACFLPYVEKNQIVFTADDFEVFLSHDDTKVKISPNSPKRQAHFLSELIIPTTNPVKPGAFKKLKPNIQLMKDNVFLQFADAVVFLLVHALSKKCDEIFYEYQMGRIKACIKRTFVTETNQKELGLELPTE